MKHSLATTLVLTLLAGPSLYAQTTSVQQISKVQTSLKTQSQTETTKSLSGIAKISATESPKNVDLEKVAEKMRAQIQGVSNGGGGATVNNKSIESYSKAPNALKGWNAVVVPTLAKLDQKLPLLARDLRNVARQGTWYLIPRIMIKIPDSYQGLPFNSDQSIININNELFIDSQMWAGKNEQDAGVLLFHEIVMLYLKVYSEYNGPALHSTTRKVASHILDHVSTETSKELVDDLVAKGLSASSSNMKTAEEIRKLEQDLKNAEAFRAHLNAAVLENIKPSCGLQPLPLTSNQVLAMNTEQSRIFAQQMIAITEAVKP